MDSNSADTRLKRRLPLSCRAAFHSAYECCGFQTPGQLTHILGTTLGSAGGVQLAIYNKTEQAHATDKLDYWESVWKRRDSFDDSDPDNYNPDQDVWRVELRITIRSFSNSPAAPSI